jgi:CoA:oxalate CoA-transferase
VSADRPLAGTKVLDLSTIVSGPLCTQILGDLGADVVKVESPAGDTSRWLGGVRKADMTGFFAQWNRNKRSVVLDLKRAEAREALRRLSLRADVLVENFRPAVMGRLGLGAEALLRENPRLVYVSINGFGSSGPDADQPAYDMVIQARGGFAKLLGSDAAPKLISNLVADKTSTSRFRCSTPSPPSCCPTCSARARSVSRPPPRPRARTSTAPGPPRTGTSWWW